MKKNKSARGLSIIELLLALVVISVGIAGATQLALGSQESIRDAGISQGALYKLDQGLEQAFAALRGNWRASVSAAGVSDGIYTRDVGVVDISECVKQVTSGASWNVPQRSLASSIAALFTSTSTISALGGDCDTTPPGSAWDAPSSHPINDPIFAGSEASDVDVVYQSGRRYALVTALHNPSPSADTLWMIDVSDLDVDPLPYSAFESGDDLLAVDGIDGVAFVAGATSTNHLPFQVYDIADPSNIALLAALALPNTDAADFSAARSVRFYGDRVYVGTDYMAFGAPTHDELHIFDVANPASPVWKTSINVDRNVNGIVVQGGAAYLATGPGGDNTVLKIYDVDPASATYGGLVGEYAAPNAQQATAIHVLGDYVYLGRERPNGSGSTEALFLIIDVSDPTTPTLADSTDLNISKGTRVSGVHVSGGIAFLVTSDENGNNQSGNVGDGPFIMYDVSNPADMSLIVPCNVLNWSEKATGMDMADGSVFVSNESNDALQVIDTTLSCS